MSLSAALQAVSSDRAAELALSLISVPSPTGDTVAVSELFAAVLRDLGMEVDVFRQYPRTPVVIGRLRGAGQGRTLILNGHLDTVPIPHPPAERRDGRVYGRGAIDMKGPLAAAVESLRAARDADVTFTGDVVLCAHGLHEAPGGHAEDLIAALEAGAIQGDAALVLEVTHDAIPVAGLGSGIYQAHFHRPDPVTHELKTPDGVPNPAFAAAEAALLLQQFNARLRENDLAYTGAESVFVGQIHGGDFYNRFPNHAWLEGTRRYAPERAAAEVADELQALLLPVAQRHGLQFEFRFERVRDGFRIEDGHPLVRAVQSAYTNETGRELPVCGIRVVADAPIFAKVGGIPCVYHGLHGEGAHGDLEFVPECELRRAARVYLRVLADFLGLAF